METTISDFVKLANIDIPEKYWDKIKIIDEKRLVYRYTEPLEVDGYSGFYHIPYFSRYAISKKGVLINLKTSLIRKWTIWRPGKTNPNTRGGYLTVPVVNNFGVRKSISRHRAKALVFIPFEGSDKDMVINHKDGVPGNDQLENLEWVTYGQNNQHAYDNNLHPEGRLIRVMVKWLDTGETKCYPSASRCAEDIGKSQSYVTTRIASPHIKFSDNLALKVDDGTPWPELTEEKRSFCIRQVVCRDIFTGDITIFESIAFAEKHTGVSSGTIFFHCRNECNVPFKGYNFRYFTEDFSFPIHPDKSLQVYKKYPSGLKSAAVIVSDGSGKEINFYESLDLAADFYKTNRQTMRKWCLRNRVIDGHHFSLYRISENFQVPPQ